MDLVHHVDVVDLVDVVIHIVDTLTPPPDDSKVSQYTYLIDPRVFTDNCAQGY